MVGPNGTIVVGDTINHRIQVCDRNTGSCDAFGSQGEEEGQFDFPLGVAVDPISGAIVVADQGNHRIQICYPEGNSTSCVALGSFGSDPGEFSGPRGVAVDPDNRNIVVADTDNHRIQVFGLVDEAELEVAFDIRPQACPNPINPRASGLLPTAILGTADFAVIGINPDTVRLEGVAPTRFSLEDVATPFEPFLDKKDALDCTEEGPDARLDLTLHFNLRSLVAALGALSPGEVRVLQVTGALHDGTAFVGEDVVLVGGR